MLRSVIKKMINNRWMSGCLLIGFILVVAMVSSIPIYTDGILQKMLTTDLENYQIQNNVFPGYYSVKASLKNLDEEERISAYQSLKANLKEHLRPQIPLSSLTETEEILIDYYNTLPAVQREKEPRKRYISLLAIPNIVEHIELIDGRPFSPRIKNDLVEVIVTENFLQKNNYLPDEVINILDYEESTLIQVKIVGIFVPKDYHDPFWVKKISEYDSAIFMHYDLYEKEYIRKQNPLINQVEWNFALDYHEITLKNIGPLLSILEEHNRLAGKYRRFLEIEFEAVSILIQYLEREKQLRLSLWIIELPVLILLFFYIFMISNLIINNEKNEIAVLKSRGQSTFQVFLIYLWESLILGLIAIICGPPLGYLVCKFMGASNGFLEFVRRTPLAVALNFTAYLYSFFTLFFLIATMMIPTYFATRTSIVALKRQKGREQEIPLWKKYFIDILILLISGYGFYRYQTQQNVLKITGASSIDIGIDPILFLTSTLFILGAGLFFLRIFPLLIKIVHQIGRKLWSPVIYCAILQVGRTGRQGQFLMLFLMFSIAIGIFDANLARTLNRNIEDRNRYKIGADITIQPVWQKEIQLKLSDEEESRGTGYGSIVEEVTLSAATHFKEPPFGPYARLAGVEKATRVFTKSTGKALLNHGLLSGIRLMGIIPHEFGEIAWFRNDLLPYHWFNYLNLLADAPTALLVSRNFQTVNKLQVGDSISFTWGNQGYVQGIIYAFIDYWPTYNPYVTTSFNSNTYLIVANLFYLQNKLAKDPYQIWISKQSGVSDEILYEDIREKDLEIEEILSASQEIIIQKNDPLLKGINGALTLGFILIMVVCTIGFLIYWMLSLQGRTLQFGILRAMGLKQRQVVSIVILEQILISGTAIFMGILIGGITSNLFIPLFQLVFSSLEQVPAFIIIASRGDYYKIYLFVSLMLASGLLILRIYIRRLKIGSALKLGED